MTTHRAIQISQLFDTAYLKAASLIRGVSNLQRIGNSKGAEHMLGISEQWTRIAAKCKARIDKDLACREQLKWAINMWENAADGLGAPAYQDSCLRTANSLRMELQTGIPHCNCHLKPWMNCPSRIESRVMNHA